MTTTTSVAAFLVILAGCAATDGERIDRDPSTAAAAGTGASGSGGTGSGGDGATGSGGNSSGAGGIGNMGNVSGSRLRARNYLGADGSKQFIGWRDTERNEDCGFTAAADGKARCLPASAASVSGYFADSGCSAPTLWQSTSCPPSASGIALLATAGSCPSAYRVHSLGPKYASATAYVGTPASCTSTPTPSLTGYELRSVGAEIPLSDFVEATTEVE